MLLRKNCLLYICAAAAALAGCRRDKTNAARTSSGPARTEIHTAALTSSTVIGSVNLAPSNPLLVAVDPYANATSSADGLKPARPFWYEADKDGLTILRIDDNKIVYRVPWPQTYDVALPEGDDFMTANAPAGGWEPVGMTVSYPTEEQLASTSETPATYVFVVMARSGYQWASNPNPPDLRDPGLRDEIVPATSPETESSMLLQLDVTDPSFSPDVYPLGPLFAGALLGHGAGQPAYDPGLGVVYVGGMPSMSLPTTPRDLTSFVSVIMPVALAETAAGEPASGAPADPPLLLCGPEHPDEGLLAGSPYVWPCIAEGGEGILVYEFENLPPWLAAHNDKLTGALDGILYGTPPTNGTWTFQARVTDLGEDPANPEPNPSEWTTVTLNVTPTGVAAEAEAGWEAGVAGGMAVAGTGTCELAPTASPGSIVPRWVESVPMPGGCAVLGTAPISGEYYEFGMPNFHFSYPYDREPVIFTGNVAGTYVFDPLPAGVGLSGLAWHQIDKIHDPSTEADILNSEFIGIEPSTGQLYRVLLPQGSIEVNEGSGPPQTAAEMDEVSALGSPVLGSLTASRSDIAAALSANPNLKVRFGDLAIEASRDPKIYLSVPQLVDTTGTVIPIGGPAGSTIENGAMLKVTGTRDAVDPEIITLSGATAIDLPGMQASFISLESNLGPAIRGVESGQVDYGALWVTGTNTGNVKVVDTALGQVAQALAVPTATSAGGVSVNYGNHSAYVAAPTLQSVALFGTGSPTEPRAPLIWTGSTMTFYEGVQASFPIVATGWPVPTIAIDGALPNGVTFVDNGDGTALVSGAPAAGTGNDYSFNITASNGVAPNAAFAVILTVVSAPVITSPNTATFMVGVPGTFPVTVNGAASLLYVYTTGAPAWLTVTTDEATGVTTLDGTPPGGSEGNHVFTITASTGTPPDAVQEFTLVVVPSGPMAPSFTSAATTAFTVGASGTFAVTVFGSPLPTLSAAGALPAGITFVDNGNWTATLSGTPAAGSAGNYPLTITASNSEGTASQAFTLIVNPVAGTAPSITVQPLNQTVNAGQTATFTAAASGNPAPTVQWQRSTDGGVTWGLITGATSNSYTTPSATTTMNGYRFRAVFTNGVGSATTVAALLTVSGPAGTAPIVTLQPTNQTVNAGQTAAFTAAANGVPAPTVQWELSTDGASWSTLAGATGNSYTTAATTAAMNGYRYRAVFTNTLGTAYSNTAILSVFTPPAVIVQPTNQTVTAGQTATFASAANGNPLPTVQWQLSTDGATWSDIGGATGTSFTTPATTTAMNGYRYRAAFTNSAGTTYSIAATLSVNAVIPTLTVVTTSLPNGTVGLAYSSTLQAQGGTAPYTWALGARRALPNGLRLSAEGVISGSPTRAGSYAFVVVVSDSASHTASQTLTVTIAPRR